MKAKFFGKQISLSKITKVICVIAPLLGLLALGLYMDSLSRKDHTLFSLVQASSPATELPGSHDSSAPAGDPSAPASADESGSATEKDAQSSEAADSVGSFLEPAPHGYIDVYIVGEINNPQVYTLPEGSLVTDLIDAAGGATADADLSLINLAYPLRNNMMIRVPGINENSPANWLVDHGSSNLTDFSADEKLTPSNSGNTLVNINTAGIDLLCSLPGVGEATAQKIIAYREANGSFSQPSDIMNVAGIKEARYEQIKDYICV